MDLKDVVYLGLISFAAIVFYFHGMYHGAQQCKKELEELLNNADSITELPAHEPEEEPETAILIPGRRALFVNTRIHGIFGSN